MRKLLFVLVAVAIFSPAAKADSVSTCPTNATLQSLISLGSCISGNVLLSGFTYSTTSTGGAVAPAADQIQVTIVPNLAITFAGPWAVGIPDQLNVQSLNVVIGWQGQALNGALFHGASVSAVGNYTGDSLYAGNIDGLFTNDSSYVYFADSFSGGDLTDSNIGPMVPFAGGSVDFTISDNYTLHEITLGTSYVPPAPTPEPASLALVGSGLLAVLMRARRRR